jgi:hypothetical protein
MHIPISSSSLALGKHIEHIATISSLSITTRAGKAYLSFFGGVNRERMTASVIAAIVPDLCFQTDDYSHTMGVLTARSDGIARRNGETLIIDTNKRMNQHRRVKI